MSSTSSTGTCRIAVLIILDEAYFEYAQDNPRYPDSMHYRYDNVITLRTFSKIYGLAGLRIGYGFAHEELITNLLKVKLPFEPSSLAQVGRRSRRWTTRNSCTARSI